MKSNHQVNIIRVDTVFPHWNADALELIRIGGYQAVVKKGQFKTGDLAVYIQPDSIVPQTEPFKFIWEQHIGLDGTVPEKRRRITVRKFRGEWSEGLLLPITDFLCLVPCTAIPETLVTGVVKEGDDVAELLGVTHYDPELGTEGTTGANENAPEGLDIPVPVYDVEAFKNYISAFIHGENVVVTEKIHGSNARFLFINDKMYAGSRSQWKHPEANCIWRKALAQHPVIEIWCRAHAGYTLYGEVVPTQKGFNYGTKEGEVKFFAFDVYSPEGKFLSVDELLPFMKFDLPWVPVLYTGPYELESIKALADGRSLIGDHIREGVVVKPYVERWIHGLGRLQLKIVSNSFLEKDSK